MVKRVVFTSALFICLLGTPFLHAEDKIVAIVNSDVITQKDLNDFINFTRMQLSEQYQGQELEDKIKASKPGLLNKLIEDRIILQEAKKRKLKVIEDRVTSRLTQIKSHYPSETAFQQVLIQQGLVQADLENRIREQILTYGIIEVEVKNKIKVSPTEVTQYYQNNPQNFNAPEQRDFETISLDNEGAGRSLINKLKKGEDLHGLSKDYSFNEDKLEGAVETQLKKDISSSLFKMQIGEFSGPFKIEDKYYIFKLDKITPPSVKKLAEVQEKIYSFLTEKKTQENLVKWLSDIKGRSYIKIIED